MKIKRFLLTLPLIVLCACGDNPLISTDIIAPTVLTITGEAKQPFGTAYFGLTLFANKNDLNKEVNRMTPIFSTQTTYYHQLFDNFDQYRDSNSLIINNVAKINYTYENSEPVVVADELFTTIQLALEYTKRSEGKFNVAIGAISSLWKSAIAKGEVPTPEMVNSSLACTPNYKDIDKIVVLDEITRTVVLKKLNGCDNDIGVQLDLGSIGKGTAVEKIGTILQSHGVNNSFINGGSSSISFLGDNKTRGAWVVGIKDPNSLIGTVVCTITKQGVYSLSTSGDYEQGFYDADGNYYHHIINDDGYPGSDFRSVTVYSDSSILSDVLSTILMNYSLNEGKNFLESLRAEGLNLDAVWIKEDENNHKLITYISHGLVNNIQMMSGYDDYVLA